jgi:hypothetical protein
MKPVYTAHGALIFQNSVIRRDFQKAPLCGFGQSRTTGADRKPGGGFSLSSVDGSADSAQAVTS